MALNQDLKLNLQLFDKDVEQIPTRDGYGKGVVQAGEENSNVVILCADLKESTRSHWFAEKFPDRFFEVGVAEQNMAAIAAGMGVSGKIPFISSYATFSPGRNWEQIRTTISYNNSNVKIAGHHAGISVGPDGATHQAVEDIATMRVMANMTVIVPCDAIEARKATIAAAKIWGPVYLRFAREKIPIITTEETPFVPGKAEVVWDSSTSSGRASRKPQAALIACGSLLYNALVAARELEKEKVNVVVVNNHTIKPLDEKKIVEVVKKCGAIVTVEEHQIAGGLGGAVAELLAKKYPAPMEFVGMQGVFGESGAPDELLEKYGMGVEDIKEAVRRVIGRK
ncbi:transketolase family protein [Candidatus Wolfebacteria bacterium]|nr:transketolase family protein [Candidatus Wolfebacteria bacterium]